MTQGRQPPVRPRQAGRRDDELHAVALLVAAGDEPHSRRCARHGIGIEVSELHTIAGQAVDIRCTNVRRAVTAGVAIPGIVGHDQHDIRPARRRSLKCHGGGRAQEQRHSKHQPPRTPNRFSMTEGALIEVHPAWLLRRVSHTSGRQRCLAAMCRWHRVVAFRTTEVGFAACDAARPLPHPPWRSEPARTIQRCANPPGTASTVVSPTADPPFEFARRRRTGLHTPALAYPQQAKAGDTNPGGYEN